MLDIYFAQNRFYNPDTRQFITQDPIKDGMNWYGYCEGNPLMNIDWLGLKPTVKEAAAMADHIYHWETDSARADRIVEGWRLIDVWYGRESMKMGIYIRDSDDWENPSEYALVFMGTTVWFEGVVPSNEFKNNIEAGISGRSANMWDAMEYSLAFINSHSKETTFIGHSKGGGEAIAAAAYNDCDAITFNAANYRFSKYVSGGGEGKIDNYYVEGEVLSSRIGTASIGETHWFDTQYWHEGTINSSIHGFPSHPIHEYEEIKIPDGDKNHQMAAIKKALGMEV